MTEARVLVLRALNLPADTELVFSRKPNHNPQVTLLIQEIDAMDYNFSGKIQAIKKFREKVVGTGLAEAKWAVEHWAEVKNWMKKNSRLPKFEGIYSNGTTRMV